MVDSAPTQDVEFLKIDLQGCRGHFAIVDGHNPDSGVNGITFSYDGHRFLLFENEVYVLVNKANILQYFIGEIAIKDPRYPKWSIYRILGPTPFCENAMAEARRLVAGK